MTVAGRSVAGTAIQGTRGYSVAAVAVASAAAVELALDSLFPRHSPLVLFTLAVMVAARFGGRRPGLAATLAGTLTTWYCFLEPRGSWSIVHPTDSLDLLLFLVAGIAISLLGGRFHHSRADLAQNGSVTAEAVHRYELLAEQSRDIFLHVRVEDGRILEVNAAATSAYGYSRDEMLSLSIHNLRAPQSSALTPGQLSQAETQGILFETLHQRKDGTCFPVEVSSRGSTVNGTRTVISVVRDITERKRAEEAARRWQQAFEQAEVGIVMSDPATETIRAANGAFARAVGYTTEELAGCLSATVFPPEAFRARAPIMAAIDRSGHAVYESLHKRKDGTVFPVLIDVTAVRDEAGRLVSRIAFVQDLTERRRKEEALRASMEHLKLAHDAARVATWEWDLRTNDNFWSDELWDLIGLEPHSCRPSYEALRQVLHPDDRARVERAVQEAARQETELAVEFRVSGHDSPERWLLLRGRPMHDADGRAVRFLGIALDITNQKRAEEALREAHGRLSAVLEDMADGFLTFDRDWRYTYVNPAAARMLSTTPEALLGRSLWEAYPRAEEAPGYQNFRRAAREGVPVHFEVYDPTLDRWYDNRCQPLREGMAVYFSDVSQRKAAETEIRRLNAELEQRVRSRTMQLEASNQELESFAYSVSHDLRAPLRGIDGWSLALIEDCRDKLDERGREYLERVRSETQRMGQLIDDLLKLSRMTRAEMQVESVDLSRIAAQVAQRLRDAHPARQLEITIEPDLLAEGDARLLEIAFANLLDNAVKFTRPRSPARIQVGRADNGGEPAFFVRDNGVGFDMTYAGKLFGAFQRLHRASEFPGSGIGLATVQRVIRRHGGKVWADAAPDRGATFYFIIGTIS